MDLPNTFKDIAPFLQQPLVLVGFVILLFFGILTALFKTNILPALPKKTVGDLVKRIINYGFILALLIIVLGFWEQMQERGKSEGSTRGGTSGDSIKAVKRDSLVIAHHDTIRTPTKPKIYCKVKLLIPSDINDAEILVDGKLADILERKPTSFTIRMEKQEISQRIVLRNSFRECTTRVLVDGDKELQPCQ